MSRASITSKRSRRRSKDGTTDCAPVQSAHTDEQPPLEKDAVRPINDKEENREPSVVKFSSGISDSGPPQPPEHHVQKNTSDDSPKGALATEANKVEAQEVQPTLSEIKDIMKQVLDVLKDSTIASKTGKDNRSRFLAAYKKVAEEHDDEFLEQYNGNMDVMLIFSGLFSAVSAAFIVSMESNLSPDPDDTTHALLTQLVLIGLGNLTAAGSTPAAPASTWSPPIASIRIQSIAYASLSFSLLAAFGAVLGKQWLAYYKSQRYGRGSEEERAKCRQEKFDGIVTWYFDTVVQSFPILLQFSLLLFGIALSANMWYEQHTIAWVIIATTVFGFLFYSLTVMVALLSPACPFQTPVSTILRMLHVDEVLRPMVKLTFRFLQKLATPMHVVLQSMLDSPFYRSLDVQYLLLQPADSTRSFVWRYLRPLFGPFQRFLPSLTRVVDLEAQTPDQNRNDAAKKQYFHELVLPDMSTSALEAPSIMWLIETSTDPEVVYAAASLVPDVDWPLHLDVSDTLHQLYDVYTSCLDVQNRIIPSLEEKASACTKALCHLYCHCILPGHEHGFLGERYQGYGKEYDIFTQMLKETKVNDNVLVIATTKLLVATHIPWRSSPKFGDCPDSALEWLSRILPFHFVTEKVDEDVMELATTVISKLLCSLSSPSSQIIANCTLLACVMVGVQFDRKVIVRVDKSSVLPQLAESLWMQFEEVWASSGDEDNAHVRLAWNLLDAIYRVIELDFLHPLPSNTMWMLGVCRKIYSRARSSQHNWDSSAALQKVQCFRFTPSSDPTSPTWLWSHSISWRGNSHSPEDFDWLVNYLGDVCSSDHNTAGDILVLLSSMRVSCSPAKQHSFIEALITCMDSSMPPHLRHAALRAAHSSREVLASIDVVDDAGMVLTNLSRAILTAVCPQPDARPTDDGPDCFFHDERDLCYLKLIFALARNSYWRPHLHCQMDRTIGMIAECCNSYMRHPFYLVGFFLRMTSEEVPATLLSSITEQQWWYMMRKAWYGADLVIDNTRCVEFEFLPVLVETTKKYKGIASNSDIEQLSADVDGVMRQLESGGQREGVEDLRSMSKGILDELRK